MLANLFIASLMMLTTSALHVAGISLVAFMVKGHIGHWRHQHPIIRARKIGGIALVMFFLSVVEIWLWAGVYMLVGAFEKAEEALYFSTVSFTTLGYGDVLLDEKWRLMGAFEAANGIIIFGLSTAAVVAALQRVYFSDAPD